MGSTRLLMMSSLAIVRIEAACPVLSEIAASPAVGNSEWIELAEVSGSALDLGGWSLGDGSEFRTITAPATLAAGGFLVVASDCAKLKAQFGSGSIPCAQASGWGRLSTEADRLVLRDAQGSPCDSVAWSKAAWGEWPARRSMERIELSRSGNDAANWVASSNPLGGTPGWKAANALEPIGGTLGIEIISRRAVPGQASASIRLRAPWNQMVKAQVFDMSRRKVATLLDGQIPANAEIVWDAKANGKFVSPGVYMVLVEMEGHDRAAGPTRFRDWLLVEK